MAVFVGVGHFVKAKTFAEYEKKTLAVVDDRLPAARERDREETTAYGVLDAAAGRYRIPVDEAVRAMIGHPESLAPIVFNQPAAEEASEPEAADGAAPGAGG
ncbi:MAG: hypothetical protein M5R36_28795 [Deltaproteobacteria bacterium]|nr:hypothetical protein [Deltaproteobacteria bacterium]